MVLVLPVAIEWWDKLVAVEIVWFLGKLYNKIA